jgi:hypothetical protein
LGHRELGGGQASLPGPRDGHADQAGSRLADAYVEASMPVVRERLYRAGIRLAMLLNDVWPAE